MFYPPKGKKLTVGRTQIFVHIVNCIFGMFTFYVFDTTQIRSGFLLTLLYYSFSRLLLVYTIDVIDMLHIVGLAYISDFCSVL